MWKKRAYLVSVLLALASAVLAEETQSDKGPFSYNSKRSELGDAVAWRILSW